MSAIGFFWRGGFHFPRPSAAPGVQWAQRLDEILAEPGEVVAVAVPGEEAGAGQLVEPDAQAGLSPEQLRATADTDPAAGADWPPRHAALLDAVDELHDTARLSESAWDALRVHYEDAQLLELLVLTGWYPTISYLANGLLLEEESWGTRFPTR
ncbi:hypothetical protein [Streptomyces sp. NBC_01187]|uniref:hypothetical protein n=1 Tax=Streptomyces sp. NBC_01187 TaxID=2903766 RepID=UPI003870CB4D|nr:hypothetical protein OG220_10845 [Streptomyces sp. NBC_01187]